MNSTNKLKETLSNVHNAVDRSAQEAADTLSAATARAKDGAAELYDEAKEAGHDLTRTAKQKGAELASSADEQLADLRSAASEKLAKAKTSLADGGDRLAEALQGAADDSRDASSKVYGAVAAGVSQVTDQLQRRNLSDLMDSAQSYARRNPGTFAAGAAVVGFALGRFLLGGSRGGRNQGPRA